MPGSQPGIFLGAQGGINWASGFHLGLRASFLVNKGIQSVVYPFYSYGYGLAVLGGGYRLPLGGDFTALTRFSLGLGGWGVSSTDTNQSGGTLQGSALMVPELLLEYYGWPVLSVGLSIRYHFFLSSPSLPGTDLGDVQGLSVGVELNLRS